MRRATIQAFAYSEHQYFLRKDGWTLIEDIRGPDELHAYLSQFGELMPQFDGGLRHEVRLEPGYENMRFSKSMNEIGPHTEAPSFAQPPKYLALFCHRPARCGSGHTCLSDGFRFLDSLSAAESELARNILVNFATANSATGYPQGGAQFPLETRYLNGRRVLRFSHNHFYYGDLHAHNQSRLEAINMGAYPELRDIVKRCAASFDDHKIEILIPENAILIWDNHRMLHARAQYTDPRRHLTRYWLR